MSPAQSARYNSNYSTNIGRRGCTAETREKIIQDLKDWARKKGGAKVYWMNGMAGTGKTTIGYSLCEWLAKVGKLGGNFFCSRAEPSCRDVNDIIPTLTIFLTSRPEPVIRQKMLEPGHSRSVLHLHDIEESVVEADIKEYLTDALYTMSPRPSSYQVEQLTKRAGRLFIYAAIVVRYIHPDSRVVVNSAARLERVLSLTAESRKQHEELDELYKNILSAAFNNDLEEDEKDSIRLTLWTVVCAREPVSLKTIGSLLSLTKDTLQTSLEPLPFKKVQTD